MILHTESCSSDDACIVLKGSDLQLALRSAVAGVCLCEHLVVEHFDKGVALVGDAAADGENVGLENIDDVNKAGNKVGDIFVNYLLAKLVALSHSVEGCSAGDAVKVAADHLFHNGVAADLSCILKLFAGSADKAGSAGVCLPAAAATAGALATVQRPQS